MARKQTMVLDQAALDLIFLEARTRNGWEETPVPESLLRRIYEVAAMGPTTANSQPQRIVFVMSQEAKEKLAPALSKGNLAKTMKAPVTAIFAYDMRFFDNLPKTLPHDQTARSWFADTGEAAIRTTALRNASLQAAYFMIAARAHGLDCGPMSGFDNKKVNAAFFADGRHESNFICSLGHGTDEKLFPRSPRLSFDEACKVA
jgi:3-hydroxypropanoate dehydrogenase